jgi:S-formylglutathione hydrolase FrmB
MTDFASGSLAKTAVRRVVRVGLSVAALLGAFVSSSPAQAQASAITYVSQVQMSPRLYELTLTTPAMATPAGFLLGANPTGQTKVRILLPQGYNPDAPQRYPVVYLYNGGLGSQADWTTPATKGDAEGMTAGLPIIVVMPDGGIASGYANWYNNGAFGPPQWETYHLDQLIPWIDAHYKTIADRRFRATAGLSMGGGGLRYAAQRPDLIGITAAFSGDIDITQPASDWFGAGSIVSSLIWGNYTTQQVRWRGVNGPDLAKNLADTDIFISSGDTGPTESTYIHQAAVAVHNRLDEFGIPHVYVFNPPWTHSWTTFNAEFGDWLPHLMSVLQREQRSALGPVTLLRAPKSFTYSSIANNYSMHGWSVQMTRTALEFSALEVQDRSHFTLIGSGSATVQTPLMTAFPHQPVRVTVTNSANPELDRTSVVNADAQGRVSVAVALGTPNPYQQYTAAADAVSSGASTDVVPFQVFNNGSRFYRSEVRLSVTPTGLCEALAVLIDRADAAGVLCALLRNVDAAGPQSTNGQRSIGALRQVLADGAGGALTQVQADSLRGWMDTF